MRTTTILIISLLRVPLAQAQHPVEATDSASTRQLEEITVEARMSTVSAKVATYIPAQRQKNAANDASSLLSLMAIPQLSIEPGSGTVKTTAGQPVSVFIDFIEASDEDLNGLNPHDVRMVEFYNSPADPRFSGKRYVVNFIMQHYVWGGYTKIAGRQSAGVLTTDGSIYSKITHKSMTFDIFAGEKYNAIRHSGNESTEVMRFTNLEGLGDATISRHLINTTDNTHSNTNDVSLRAIYDSDNAQLINRVGINYRHTPATDTRSHIDYYNDLSGQETALSTSSNNDLTIRYAGQYIFSFPHNLSLNVGARFEYGNSKINLLYRGADNLTITNNAREKSFYGTINPNLYWQINDLHTLRTYLVGSWRHHNILYAGSSSSRQTYGINGYQAGISYDFDNERWSTHLNIALTGQTNAISDYTVHPYYPRINAEATYSPSENSQLIASYGYYETLPSASATSPVVLRQDELIYYAGNPQLRNSPTHEAALQGIWIPSDKWQMALTGFHYNISDRQISAYTPDGPGGTMLRYYTNNGSYMSTMFGFSVTAKFLAGKLSARLNPQLWLRRTTGIFAMRRNELTCTAQLTYYLGNMYFMGSYGTPSHYPDENSGIERRTPCQYMLKMGWGNRRWNLGFEASNFMRYDWRAARETLRSEFLDSSAKVYSPGLHAAFAVTATYTFGYGKKLDRHNELDGEAAATSAILK